MNTKRVTVTISGAAGTGKSFVGRRVVEALKAAGFGVETVDVDPIREEFAADPERFATVANSINVVVREVQTARGT